jgi:RNA polymerase sigma factor (sigma-70 family)
VRPRRRNPEADACDLVRARTDPAAFRAFYDRYSPRIVAFLMHRTYDPEVAVDLASETFAIALERIDQFRGSTAAEEQGWLYAIAKSQLSRYWRDGASERSAVMRMGIRVPELSDDDFDAIFDLAEIDFLRPELGHALAALSPDQRTAVELKVIQELSYREAAERLGITEQVVRARVSRGLRAMALSMNAADLAMDAS